MKKLFVYLAANAVALYLISLLLAPNFIITGGIKGYLVAGVIIGLVNSIVKPILKILSFPLVLMTAGLFIIALNVFILVIARYLLNVLAFEGTVMQIGNLPTYLYAAVLIGLGNYIIHKIN